MSFVIYEDRRWQCFGKCARGGDVIDLEMALSGRTKMEARDYLNRYNPKLIQEMTQPVYELTPKDRDEISKGAKRLAEHPGLALKVREDGPWMSAIAAEAECGHIGFMEDNSGPALFFVYPHGVKARWAQKKIRWIKGGPSRSVWRQDKIGKRVFVTEGEIDCLTLLGAGYPAVALASSTSFPDPKIFTDREVVLVMDSDEAGQKCALELSKMLRGISKAVVTAKVL